MALEGKQFSSYRVLQLIGKGGMGEVYLAEDIQMQRQVALKVIKIEALRPGKKATASALRLFSREIAAVSELDHANIQPLYSHGETALGNDVIVYMMSPYRPEGSLITWLHQLGQNQQSRQLTPRQAIHIVRQASAALQYAHDQQIWHLDVKPANFLVRRRSTIDEYPDLLLSDFGIAYLVGATPNQYARGAPTYVAPEQFNNRPVFASDQYALAVMAYELLAGSPPFQGTPQEVMTAHLQEQPRPVQNFIPLLEPEVDQVLQRALAKKPQERFPSVSVFAQAFQAALRNAPTTATLRALRVTTFAPAPYLVPAAVEDMPTLTLTPIATEAEDAPTLTAAPAEQADAPVPADLDSEATLTPMPSIREHVSLLPTAPGELEGAPTLPPAPAEQADAPVPADLDSEATLTPMPSIREHSSIFTSEQAKPENAPAMRDGEAMLTPMPFMHEYVSRLRAAPIDPADAPMLSPAPAQSGEDDFVLHISDIFTPKPNEPGPPKRSHVAALVMILLLLAGCSISAYSVVGSNWANIQSVFGGSNSSTATQGSTTANNSALTGSQITATAKAGQGTARANQAAATKGANGATATAVMATATWDTDMGYGLPPYPTDTTTPSAIPPGQAWQAQRSRTGDSLSSVVWTGTQFVAVGSHGDIRTSPDGITWSGQNSHTTEDLSSVVVSDTPLLVAVGTGGTILTSPNGVTWTVQHSGITQDLWSVAWTDSFLFVATGSGGTILTSTNGKIWTVQLSNTGQILDGAAWSVPLKMDVVIGDNGTILTSPDGTTWTVQNSGSTQLFESVTWGNKQFVITGSGGTVLTSSNGSTWVAQRSNTTQNLNGVTWSNTQFVITGDNGTILTSPNGDTWTVQKSGTTQSLSSVVWSITEFVAVGKGGTVLTSS